jgi:hypothetical protein
MSHAEGGQSSDQAIRVGRANAPPRRADKSFLRHPPWRRSDIPGVTRGEPKRLPVSRSRISHEPLQMYPQAQRPCR